MESKMVESKRAMKKRSRDVGNNSANWGGKILVEKSNAMGVSDYHVVDLRGNRQDRKIGGFVLNRDGINSVVGKVGMKKKLFLFAIAGSMKKGRRNKQEDVEGDVIHSGVSYYDASSSKNKWKPLLAKMLIPDRVNPTCVSLGSKIFVFCGVRLISDCFGEFYDTADKADTGKWRPILIPPTVPVDLSACFVSDPINNRILCIFPLTKSLYAYYPDQPIPDQRWTFVHFENVPLSGFPYFFANAPILDHVLLFFHNTAMFSAYDIRTNQTLPVSWSSHTPFGPRDLSLHTFDFLLSLGDDVLCLPDLGRTEFDPATGRRNKVVLLFYRFSAHREPCNGMVVITPLQVHRIPVQGFNLVCHFLPL